ncbi:hypothetical protein AgCh_030221 [Apium graveolens]
MLRCSSENETYPDLVHLPAADEISLNLLLERLIKDKITLSDSYNSIVTCVPGESNPVIECLNKLKQFEIDSSCDNSKIKSDFNSEEVIGVLNELTELCGVEGSGNAAIATRNGGLELVCLICSRVPSGCGRGLVSCLNALVYLLHDLQCTEIFRNSNGPEVVMRILNDGTDNVTMLSSGFSVIAAAATGNEVLKELFMDLKVDELMITVLKEQKNETISSLYDAIRVLLSADDNRVVASQVFGYARRFAKIGIAEALVRSLRDGIRSPSLVSESIALKAVAFNDEICRSVAESGGIDAILCCINDSGAQRNQIVAQTLCSLLNKGETNGERGSKREGKRETREIEGSHHYGGGDGHEKRGMGEAERLIRDDRSSEERD